METNIRTSNSAGIQAPLGARMCAHVKRVSYELVLSGAWIPELKDVIDDVPITYTEYKRSPNPFFADYLGGGLGSVTSTGIHGPWTVMDYGHKIRAMK